MAIETIELHKEYIMYRMLNIRRMIWKHAIVGSTKEPIYHHQSNITVVTLYIQWQKS